MEAQPTPMDVSALLAESEWIGGLAARLLRDRDGAEDLAQETRLAALRSGIGSERPSRPWLATVARNGARMLRRSDAARAAREVEHATDRASEDRGRSADELLSHLETQEMVSRFVRELPAELADVVMLSFFEGRSPAEIAELRGVPPGTVRWRKSEALKRLRERLDTQFDGDRSAWFAALLPLAQPRLGSGAAAATASAGLGGLFTGWIAMSLTWKAATSVALVALMLVGAMASRDADVGPAAAPDSAAAVVQAEDLDLIKGDPAPVAIVDDGRATGAREPAHPDAAREGVTTVPYPVTRVRLRVVDESGRPVAGVAVTPSLSAEMESHHRDSFEALDAIAMAALLADVVRTTEASGVVSWETDFLRESGEVSFHAVGPRFATGQHAFTIQVGEDTDAGDLVLRRAGQVSGRVVHRDGSEPGRQMVFMIEVGSPLLEGPQDPFELIGHKGVTSSVHTDHHGAFEIDGAPPGEYVLTTSALTGYAPVLSDPFEVTAGQALSPLELFVEPLRLGLPQVRVLGADGEPLETASVTVTGSDLTFSGPVDEGGLYSLKTTYARFAGGKLEVSDRSLRHRPYVLETLPEEPQTITVRMESASTVEVSLRLVANEGVAVGQHRVTVTANAGEKTVDGSGAEVALVLPSGPGETFALHVEARGFEPLGRVGMSAAEIVGPWVIELAALPGISGQVRTEDGPVARAKVTLHRAVRAGSVRVRGNAVSECGQEVDSVRTDREGRFVLHPAEDGDYVVLVAARRKSDAARRLGGVKLRAGVQALDVLLHQGGTLEGRVLDHRGEPSPRALLVLSHPLHGLLRKRADKNGRYQFRSVPAGDWYLRMVTEYDGGFIARHRNTPAGWTYPSNCRVSVGGTTAFDLDLAPTLDVAVEGALTTTGLDAGPWTMQLATGGWSIEGGDPFTEEWESEAPVDGTGRFVIAATSGQEYILTATAKGLGATLRRSVAPRELPLILDVQIGLAEFTARPQGWSPAAGSMGRLHVSWTDGEWEFQQSLIAGPDGAFGPARVPAGSVSLSWDAPGTGQASMDVALSPGERRSLELR